MCSLALHGRSAALLVLLACALNPGRIEAQEDCEFVAPTRSMVFTTLTGGATITYLGGPHMLCGEGIEIWADSAVEYSAQRLQHMMGSVRFIDANGELNADEARYFAEQGRLQANGHVFVQDTIQGFTIENGSLVYLRATDFRTEPQMTVTTAADGIRPHAILQMKPAEARPTDAGLPEADTIAESVEPESLPLMDPAPPEPGSPYIVDGDRIFIQGDSYFRATGNVEIERDSLLAFADSVEYNQVAGRILLEGSARVDGPTYDLVGRTITLGMDGDAIDELRAVEQAVLTGDDLELRSPEIRIYLRDDLLHRLVAVMRPVPSVGLSDEDEPERPIALAEDFQLTADSIEVTAPAEVLERIFAGGAARSVSHARDSLNVEVLPKIARTDWLEGDTVIVTFVSVDDAGSQIPADRAIPDAPASTPGADSAQSEYRIDRIVARVEARSLYRLPPSDTTARPGKDAPAVHYVLGDEITILMAEGEVDRMEVLGQTRGVHLEPVPVVAVLDSLTDSLATQLADTGTVVARDTTVATARDTATTSATDAVTVRGARPRTPQQQPSPAPDSGTPDGRPHIRESAATLNSWSGP
jgi:lipopolysaccharide export system protein LptA